MIFLYLSALDTPEEKRKFERLYLQYRKTMYYVALQILKDEHHAEDAVHQAFLKLIKHLDKIVDCDSYKAKAFLTVITEHAAIDLCRKLKREQVLSYEEAASCIASPSASSCEHTIYTAIAKLPKHYEIVLTLRYAHGYNMEEIADMLDLTPDNVRQRISRAKQKLQELLDREEERS